MTEADRRMKILDEKYEKINEQNKRFKNPHGHIHDKYRNSYSPYFRNDLTKVEREAAYTMEIAGLILEKEVNMTLMTPSSVMKNGTILPKKA